MIENAYSYMLEARKREANKTGAHKRGIKHPKGRITTAMLTMQSEHGEPIAVRRTRYSTEPTLSRGPRDGESLRITRMREALADRHDMLEEQWARRAAECKHVLDAYLAVTKTPNKAGAVSELNRYREQDNGFMSEVDINMDITKYFLKRLLNHLPSDPLYDKLRNVRATTPQPNQGQQPDQAQHQGTTYDTWGEP